MIFETVSVGPLMVNCYILASKPGASAIIIDPGQEKHKIDRKLKEHNLTPGLVINTHGHIDHIGCDDDFGVAVYAHKFDAVLLKDQDLNLSTFLVSGFTVKTDIMKLEDGQKVVLDDIELEIIHTPGHTPGGICLLLKSPQKNILFSGDSLFKESVGRTDFKGASHQLLMRSIKERLLVLDDEVLVFPGHGPKTTIGYEKAHNPFLI